MNDCCALYIYFKEFTQMQTHFKRRLIWKRFKEQIPCSNLFYLLKHTALSSTSRVAHIPINSNDYIPCSICYTLHIIEIYTKKNSIKKAFPQRRKAYFLKHSSFFPKLKKMNSKCSMLFITQQPRTKVSNETT